MPIVDMPLEKLKVYGGRNPRPEDFDEFWDKSLEEMRSVDPHAVFTLSDFKSNIADVFDLTFTSVKNAKIHAIFARPKNIEGKVPAIIRFHGLSGFCGEYTSLLTYASQGYCMAALDCRGQGGHSEDVGGYVNSFSSPFSRGLDGKPTDLLCRDMFLDAAMLARIIMGLDCVDGTRVGVMGGSQGGALSIACAALVPEIKLCAARYPYLSDYKRVWEMDLAKGAYEGLKYYFRSADPTHEREEEIFTKLGYIDIQHLAPRVRARVMMSTGLMDTTCPPSTQFAMYNKLTCDKSVVIYPDYGHETLKTDDDRVFKFMSAL